MITVGIYSSHAILLRAMATLLATVKDFNVLELTPDSAGTPATKNDKICNRIKIDAINIFLCIVQDVNVETFALIKQISQRFERVRVLVLATSYNETLIVQSIRAGARGFIASDADAQELFEAIYTLRNGHDFYSKSVSQILVGKYINGMMDQAQPTVDCLSNRQIEILKLWGDNKSNKEIADKLFLSVRTVESHKNHIMQKLNLKSSVDMIKFGIRNNLIEL